MLRKKWMIVMGLMIVGLLIFAGCTAVNPTQVLSAQAGPIGPQGAAGPQGPKGDPGPAGKDGAPGKSVLPAPGAGLIVKISKVDLPAGKNPVVTLAITDGGGTPLSSKALEGYGFTIAQVTQDQKTGLSQYQNLLVHEVDGKPYQLNGETTQPVLNKATQAYADSGGIWEDQPDGTARYTFKNALSSPADNTLTTVVGVYAYKDGRASVSNDVFTFLPAGGSPQLIREVVSTDACQGCHNPLEAHGGLRRDTRLCVTCHTGQTTDPETGNTLDFKVLVHKLHTGSSLPSVVAGTPYQIIGYQQSLTDFSSVSWPQDVRNCTTCHSGGAQSDNYKTQPSTAACTACHDTTNVVTGVNHPGGKQTDEKCASCHTPEGDQFGLSVSGAHTLPLASKANPGLKLEIVSITGAVPGGSPVVKFKATNNAGETVDANTLNYVALTLAGPTSDYTNRWTETALNTTSKIASTLVKNADGSFSYQFKAVIPKDATGTYAVGMEAYALLPLVDGQDPIRVTAFNPVAYAALDGGKPAPRRQVVDENNCNACHKALSMHGGNRQNTEYCVLCHNPMASDADTRPADASGPATSISFPLLIHKLHTGAEASNPLVIYGRSGKPTSFADVVFPGDRSACQTCHLPGTNALPLANSVHATTITKAGSVVSTILPTRAICTSCHDDSATSGHVELNTTASGIETCAVCHGQNREFDVTKVHK